MYDGGNNIIIGSALFLWILIALFVLFAVSLISTLYFCGKKSREAKSAKTRFDLILISTQCSMAEVVVTDRLILTCASDNFFTFLGYTKNDFSEKNAFENYIKSCTLSSDWNDVFAAFKKAANEKGEIHCRCCAVKNDGNIIRVKIDGAYSGCNDFGKPVIEAVFSNVTAAHDALTMMQKDKERYLKLLSIHDDFCFEYNFRDDIIHFSENIVKIFNIPIAISGFKSYICDFDEKTADNLRQVGFFDPDTFSSKNVSTVKIKMLNRDGTYHWYNIDFLSDSGKNGANVSVIGRGTDITSEKEVSDYMIQAAKTDLMTGLFNKVTTEDKIVYELLNGDNKSINAFIMLDIDNFKFVNDRLGHSAGDNALKTVADILKDNFRSNDILGRIGGDEFSVYMKNLNLPDLLDEKINSLLLEIQSISVSDSINISCSAGVVCFKSGAIKNFNEMYTMADNNLYKAKLNGKNRFSVTKVGV